MTILFLYLLLYFLKKSNIKKISNIKNVLHLLFQKHFNKMLQFLNLISKHYLC